MNVKLVKVIDKYILSLPCFCMGILSQAFSKENPETKKVLIIKLWATGDSILSLPLIECIRGEYPVAKIDILAHENNKEVYTGQKIIDSVIKLSFFNVLRMFRKYDLCFDTEPFLNISALISLFSSRFRVGFAKQMRSTAYTKSVPFNCNKHVVQNYLDMARVIGLKCDTNKLVKLVYNKKDKQKIDSLLKSLEIKKNDLLIGLCTGISGSAKTRAWPKEKYAELANILIKKYRAKVIFVDSRDNREYVNQIQNMVTSSQNHFNLAGKTTLKETFALIERCNLFVSNDTGPMHISAAQSVKTIGLFGPNTPVLWAPYGKNNAEIYKKVGCSPCIINNKGIMPECIYKNDKNKYQCCMKQIKVKDVLGALDKLLRSKR